MAGWAVPYPFEDAADAECGEGNELYPEAFADVLYGVIVRDYLGFANGGLEFQC